MMTPRRLILASGSPYRRQLLERLKVPFDIDAPDIDEQPLPGETPAELVVRLAIAKATAVGARSAAALVIGSDQVAVVDGAILGKPGTSQRAFEQLRDVSGKRVDFLTGLCLLNTDPHRRHADLVPYTVYFRTLSDDRIRRYLERESPLHCAGAFQSEGLGGALVERYAGDDPTALVGLPLIRLVTMLRAEGFDVLG